MSKFIFILLVLSGTAAVAETDMTDPNMYLQDGLLPNDPEHLAQGVERTEGLPDVLPFCPECARKRRLNGNLYDFAKKTTNAIRDTEAGTGEH